MQRKSLTSDDPAEHFDTKVREVWIDVDKTPDFVIGLRVDVMIHTENKGMVPAVGQTGNQDQRVN